MRKSISGNDFRSREFRELLDSSPPWPVRWGMMLIPALIGILFLAGWNLKIPERIRAKITFNSPDSLQAGNILMDPRSPADYYNSVRDTGVSCEENDLLSRSGQSALIPVTGYMILSQESGKKISIGQRVEITLNQTMAPKSGKLQGAVQKVTLIKNDREAGHNYLIEVGIPENLNASGSKFKVPVSEIAGKAEIITGQQRFLILLLDPLFSLNKRRMLTN